MNTTISLVIDKKDAAAIKKTAKVRGYASASEYIRSVIKADQEENLISVEKILRRSRDAKKLYKLGKLKSADSLADLLT